MMCSDDLSIKLPRFGPGELPVEYIPLNNKTLKIGDKFGPISFHISKSSHHHHLEYLRACSVNNSFVESDFLYPFEYWPLPRAMSQWYFGRINEVISIRAKRILRKIPNADHELEGETTVKSLATRKGLCFGFFESVTRTATGEVCMESEDVLLLANGCDPNKLREAVSHINLNTINIFISNRSSILNEWSLKMRYPWPENKWINNIHTGIYARSLGYKCGLVEGPGVSDVIFSIDRSNFRNKGPHQVYWNYKGPLYFGTPVVLIFERIPNLETRRYLLCESPKTVPGTCRILLKLEVKNYEK